MATTQNTYTGNGSTILFSFTFPYLDESDIKVEVNGTLTTAYTLANATTIQFNTAPANGAAVRIYRETASTETKATFFPGSAVRAQDLNDNFAQVLYVSQEIATVAENQSTAGLQAQITAATNTANNATVTANAASVTANGIASTANSALSAANSAVSTANTASTNATTAINTAGAAQITANAAMPKTGGTFTGDIIVPSINGGPLAGMRNLLINGNPIINQRGYVSGTATSGANQYTLDRWRVVTSGQSITFTDSANVRTVTAPAGGIEQVIEGLNILSGTYVLNWTGTATATVDGVSVAKGGTVTLTGGTNCTVRFSGGTLSLPQLEPGTVATPFERRSYGQELSLCQRYFGSYYHSIYANTAGSTTVMTSLFPSSMRASPTFNWFPSLMTNVASFSANGGSTGFRGVLGTGGSGAGEWLGTVTASAEL